MNVGADLFPGTLDEYLAHIVRAFRSGLESFVILAKSEFTTDVGQKGTKIIAQTESSGIKFYSSIYLFAGRNDQKFMITCSALIQGWDAYEKIFDTSIKTFKAPA